MIIRRRHTANFTTIGNVLFEDKRLALDEVGLMAWLLSKQHDWEVRRPALMRHFKIGRDGLRRILRALIRYGWIRAEVTRSQETGRVYVIYEVRDEPGPELSEDQARAALSLGSSGAGASDPPDDDGDQAAPDVEGGGADPPSAGADPGATAYGAAVGGEPPTAKPPRSYKESQKTDSLNPESTKAVRPFSDVKAKWPAEHVLSAVTCERLHAALTDAVKETAYQGVDPYLAECRTVNRKICDLATFYREHRWERFAGTSGTPKHARIKVYSPQWHRWRAYRMATGQSVKYMDYSAQNNSNGIWSEPSDWPPPLPKAESADQPNDSRSESPSITEQDENFIRDKEGL